MNTRGGRVALVVLAFGFILGAFLNLLHVASEAHDVPVRASPRAALGATHGASHAPHSSLDHDLRVTRGDEAMALPSPDPSVATAPLLVVERLPAIVGTRSPFRPDALPPSPRAPPAT